MISSSHVLHDNNKHTLEQDDGTGAR